MYIGICIYIYIFIHIHIWMFPKTPKSSISMGCSLTNYPKKGILISGSPHKSAINHDFSMVFYGFPLFSMVFLWFSHGFPMCFHGCPMFFHGFSMVFPGFPMIFPGPSRLSPCRGSSPGWRSAPPRRASAACATRCWSRWGIHWAQRCAARRRDVGWDGYGWREAKRGING